MDNTPLYKLYELYRQAIIEKTREESEKYYLGLIEKLTFEYNKLKLLLEEHNIAY